MTSAVNDCLAEGAQALGVPLTARMHAQLCAYLALLQKWGAVYNLTAIREPRQAVVHHVLDALAIVPLLRARVDLHAGWVADIGSGAGVPGLVLAIVEPEMRLLSVDAVSKKIAFQRQVCADLGLPQVEVQSARIETLARPCHLVLSRALASLTQLARLAAGLRDSGTIIAAMKGQREEIAQEMRALNDHARVEVLPVQVPGLAAERHLVLMHPPALPG